MITRRLWLVVVGAVILGAGVGAAIASEDDVQEMLDGVTQIGAPGVPGPLCVYGDAFPVAAGKISGSNLAPVAAAANWGKGRVVALGHGGYFYTATLAEADTGRFVTNVIQWVSTKRRPRVGVRQLPDMAKFLEAQSLQSESLDGANWRDQLANIDVLIADADSLTDEASMAAVREFVRNGGGLVTSGLGWGWQQLNPTKDLINDHPGNRLLRNTGIMWADGYLEHTGDIGYTTQEVRLDLTHAGLALDALIASTDGKKELTKADTSQAVWTLMQAARTLPANDELLRPKLRGLQAAHATDAIPTPAKPLTMDQPLARLALALQLVDMRNLPPSEIKAHPAAAAFPGAVPADAPRVTQTEKIDTGVPDWHSTGLYAAPGEMIRVTFPTDAANKGLTVRIGCHNDSLWHLDSWQRCPEICMVRQVTTPVMEVANAFGGPVYIEVPWGCKLGTIEVTIAGAVAAPHYVLGTTDAQEWQTKMRDLGAPWAEFETRKVILTLPSDVIRKIDDPREVMEFWDQVMDACADLAGRPRDRERPERYVPDTQISIGYMHSGYPLMTLMDIPVVEVDKPRMMANGHGGIWGLFHESGHNHQAGEWTFDGTGEVTCNLFTLYVFDTVCNYPITKHESFAMPARDKAIRKYLDGGADFNKWKNDAFLALIMYIQLQEGFGWDAYKAVFREYRNLPDDQRPKTDDGKRDQWMVRMSRQVGRNLGPFFAAWGVPTSEKARQSIADLPEWMPEGFPPDR